MTVAELQRPPVLEKLASFEDGCPLCDRPIEKGEAIRATTPELGWAHPECAEDYFEAYPEKEPRAAWFAEHMGEADDPGRLAHPPVKRCDRQTCRCLLADIAATYLYTDLEEDRLVVLCFGCARDVEANDRERFQVVPL